MRVLFLDIDGVLNGHQFNVRAQSNGILRHAIKCLNHVVAETDCKIVLSSAWRYMIHGQQMTKLGFAYMLRTHGGVGIRIEDVTCRDEDIHGRGNQIAAWLRTHPVESFAVVDDEWYEGPLFVRRRTVLTDGRVGLTGGRAVKLISLLKRKWNRRSFPLVIGGVMVRDRGKPRPMEEMN